MPGTPRVLLLGGLLAASCESYAPEPVDLVAHARDFAERMPDAASVRQFAEALRQQDPARHPLDLADGLDRDEAQLVALVLNPQLRALRLRAGIARASADNAGRWADPELNGDFARILESVQHPWIVGVSLGVTLPITGRLGLEKELAQSRHAQALIEARVAEARVLAELTVAWARWSALLLKAGLLENLVRELTALDTIAARLAAAQEVTLLDARTFTMERIARQAELARTHAAITAAELETRRILGLAPGCPVRFVPATAVPLRIQESAQRRALLQDAPGVALAWREHEVSERHLALAIRKQWPDLTLFPGFQEEDGMPRAALGFTLPLPLWNRNAREIAEARTARDAAAEVLRGSLEHATQDLARAELKHTAAREQRTLIESQLVPLAEQQLQEGRRLADLGRLDTLLILDAVTRSHDTKALALQAALEEAEATVEINSLFWPSLTVDPTPEAGR